METIHHILVEYVVNPNVNEVPAAALFAGFILVVVLLWIAKESLFN